MYLREKKMEEEVRQRELDRELRVTESRAAREVTQQNNLLVAGVLSRLLPGGGAHDVIEKKKDVEVQFEPNEGSQPFPMILSLTTLEALLRSI